MRGTGRALAGTPGAHRPGQPAARDRDAGAPWSDERRPVAGRFGGPRLDKPDKLDKLDKPAADRLGLTV